MIKFIASPDTFALRHGVLLPHRPTAEDCRFPPDDEEGSFHLGYYVDEQLTCVATFHKQPLSDYPGNGYQLRGMATLPEFRKKGLGNQVVNFAIIYLRGQKVNYLWCNARRVAYPFYIGIGFEFISDEFTIDPIGPHRKMYLKIQ